MAAEFLYETTVRYQVEYFHPQRIPEWRRESPVDHEHLDVAVAALNLSRDAASDLDPEIRPKYRLVQVTTNRKEIA